MTRQAGVTLVEMMVAIAIIAILLVLGVPSFATYMANSKIRGTAEVFLSGLQSARTEAVRLNTAVEFVLTDTAAIRDNVASAVPSATGRNWIIRTADMANFIEGKSGSEGAGAGGAEVDAGAVSTITFNGLGVTDLAAATTIHFTNSAGGACAPDGPMRCLDVVISAGGQARLCDPAVSDATDTRKC